MPDPMEVHAGERPAPPRLRGRARGRVGVAFLPLVAAASLLAVAVGPASAAPAQIDPGADGNIIITDAATGAYPGDQNPLVVCVDGSNSEIMEVGDQYFVEEPAGTVDITVFDNDAATCSDVPDRSIAIPLAAGDLLGLVIGSDGLTTFTYDISCMAAGEGRVLVANAASFTGGSVDVYATSQTDGQRVALAKALAPAATTYAQGVPAGTYLVEAYAPGADPDDGPPLAFITDLDLVEGTFFQVFMAGSTNGGLGGFTFQQGPDVCTEEEPPPEETGPTTTTVASLPVAAPAEAVAATPVSGTATFTG
jgi:hypothetical protein